MKNIKKNYSLRYNNGQYRLMVGFLVLDNLDQNKITSPITSIPLLLSPVKYIHVSN
ncbi:hypothetical protein BH10BAC4_BH10BAC4_18250 [soil metagenome]